VDSFLEASLCCGCGICTVIGCQQMLNPQAIATAVKGELAKQGVTAVLMNGENTDYIYIYDKDGTLLSEIETVVARDGFPLAIALSEDGTKKPEKHLSGGYRMPVNSICGMDGRISKRHQNLFILPERIRMELSKAIMRKKDSRITKEFYVTEQELCLKQNILIPTG